MLSSLDEPFGPLATERQEHVRPRSETNRNEEKQERERQRNNNQNESLNRNGNGTERRPLYMYRLIIPSADRQQQQHSPVKLQRA